jgi:hypothetical protein
MKRILLLVLLFGSTSLNAQETVSGIIIDSNSRQPLSFATVQTNDGKYSVISGLNGKFRITIPAAYTSLNISFIGYRSKKLSVTSIRNNDTIELSASHGEMNEVVIYSNEDKIRRIINTAVRNKPLNNPEQYDAYECHVYYKMNMAIGGLDFFLDSTDKAKRDSLANLDTTLTQREKLRGLHTILLSETYSKRNYKKPQQLQEIVLASKFSGIKKTYFTNVVTDILPFHVYKDYITLNSKDYSNPIAKGWQQRYKFTISDQLIQGSDTVFLLEFEPKSEGFNGLNGIVYINSNGYAISHFICNTGDTTADRSVKMEQIYTRVNGKWFPRELNYNLSIRRLYKKQGEMLMNGHSVIDSVSFPSPSAVNIDKAHSVKLSDSVDLRSASEWERYRPEPLTDKEKRAYKTIDSLSEAFHLEQKIYTTSYLAVGRLPMGKIDFDISRFYANNRFEGARLGAGVFTNNNLSKYFSLGGWLGYGTQDKNWKYGGSLSLFPSGKKENNLGFSYQQNLKNPGEIYIHPELSKKGLSNWLLGKVDRIEQTAISASLRKNYWEFLPEVSKTFITPMYADSFHANTNGGKFLNDEVSLGIRYAYAEKRIPMLDYYTTYETKYPVVYFRAGLGEISSGKYSARYTRVLTAITYNHHINRWGNDQYRIEAGSVQTDNQQPLPLSVLLAGNGIRMKGFNYYRYGGFITMRPYEYFTDKYVSFLYKHDFDRYLWNTKFSKPSVSIAHNLVYGKLNSINKKANPMVRSFEKGYHETGLIINNLIKKDLRFADIGISVGAFHHWSNEPWRKNTVFVFSINFGF